MTKTKKYRRRRTIPNAKKGALISNRLKTYKIKKYQSIYGKGQNLDIRNPRLLYF